MKRAIKLISSFFKDKEEEEVFEDELTVQEIEEFKKEDERTKKRQQLFERVVGDTPLKQIDWILKHGMKAYIKWCDNYHEGNIHTPATVKYYPFKKPNRPDLVDYNVLSHDTYEGFIRGGRGNKELWSFYSNRVYKEIIETTTETIERTYRQENDEDWVVVDEEIKLKP